MLDYLRLATWDEGAYLKLSYILTANMKKPPEKHGWLQYKGKLVDGIFLGVAEQKGRRHTVISASGQNANRLANLVHGCGLHLYCTRIDLQRTILRPSGLSLRQLRDDCRIKNTTLIESDKNDTLYLGSRESDVFTRLYEKPIDEEYLRLEFELKGKRARRAWEMIASGTLPEVIFEEYRARCAIPKRASNLFKVKGVDASGLALREELDKKNKDKLTWLVNLDNTVKEMITDPDIGPDTHILIRTWYEYAQRYGYNLDN